MVPTAEQTAVNRQLAAGACRLVGLVMVLTALYTWIGQIEFGTVYGTGQASPGGGSLGQIATLIWYSTYWYPCALVLLGIVFWCAADRIAKRLVRLPKSSTCPGCGYSLRAMTDPRCPECGLTLSEAFMPERAGHGDNSDAGA